MSRADARGGVRSGDGAAAAPRGGAAGAGDNRQTRARRGVRRFLAPVAALAGAGLLAGAAAMPWWTRDYRDPLTGPVRATLSGSQLVPALIPLALIVVAGLGAALLTRGVVRRIIGIAVAAAGFAAAVLALTVVGEPSDGRLSAQLTRPADAVAAAARHVGGPLAALIGGGLSALAGIVVMVARSTVGNRNSAYEAPAARRERARAVAAPGAGGDRGSGVPAADALGAEDGQLWRALDAGIDPTSTDPRRDDASGG